MSFKLLLASTFGFVKSTAKIEAAYEALLAEYYMFCEFEKSSEKKEYHELEVLVNSATFKQQKKALQQNARALSSSLTVDTADKVALQKVANDMSNASWCIYTKITDGTAGKTAGELEKMIVNTKNRFLQYEKFNSALSGSVSTSPVGDGCDN